MAPPMTFGGIDSAGAVDDAFWTWATAEGVEAVSCAPALFREGWRGVAATGDVAPGDVVLRVPGSLLMSARSAARDPDLAAALETHGGALSPAERLSCHLLHESSKGARSRWSAYVKQLPRRYNLLACWTDTEIEALQAPEAIAVAERAATDMRASHERALPTLKHLGLPLPFRSARAWKWARSTVSSRTVFVPFDDAGALCPVGDLFNYAPPAGGSAAVDVIGTPLSSEALGSLRSLNDTRDTRHTRGLCSRESPRESSNPKPNQAPTRESAEAGDGSYDARADAYVFYARRRYGRGDQIMLCYGAHTNLSLLEHYGFLLPPETTNGNDAAPLAPIPAFGGDSIKNTKPSSRTDDDDATTREDATRHRLTTDAFGRLSWTALADLRVDAACADADVRRLGLAKRARDVCRRGDAVSPAVERRVFEAVRDAAGRTLLGLGTTAARDEADIAAASARASERATAIPASSTRRETRDAGLDEHGAPREWTRVDDDDDDDDADFQTSHASNARLAARWRLAYKRAVQAAYRRAQARVDEAVEAMRAEGRGDAITPSSDARVAKPRLRAAR